MARTERKKSLSINCEEEDEMLHAKEHLKAIESLSIELVIGSM